MRCAGIALLALLAGAQACPDGFFPHGESCYAIPDLKTNWAEAKVYCQAVGADLARVETKEEHSLLVNHVKRYSAMMQSHDFWLDACDYVEEGVWFWTATRQGLAFSAWAPGQPDNYDSQEHCLALHGGFNYQWNDDHCQEEYSFICETPQENGAVVIG